MSRVNEAREQALLDADAVRSKKGFSYRNIADLMRIDASAVGEYLRGERWPNGPNQAKLEAAIGWPTGELNRRARKYAKQPALANRWANDDKFRARTALLMATSWRRRGLGEGDTINGLPWSRIEPILAVADPNANPDDVIRLASALDVPIDANEGPSQDLPKLTGT